MARSPDVLGLYTGTVLVWGTTWFAITLQLGVVHPAVSVAWRYVLAALVLIAWCRLRGRSLRVPLRLHPGIALQGLFLFSLNYIVFYYAAAHVESGLLAVVFSTIVFMNIGNGALLFGTRVQRRVLAGAVLGLAGISLVFLPEIIAFDTDGAAVRGLALGIGATYLASLGNMASAWNQRHGVPVLEANALGMAYGAVFTLIVTLLIGAELRVQWTPAYLGSLFYLALIGSVVGFGCYLTLLGRIGADRAAYATVLFPIIALALSTVLEGYRWTPASLAGVVLILAGNVLVLRKTPQRAA